MFFFSEYGGRWKMLHYFAKKFFDSQLISPYVDGENVTVYYISDEAKHSITGVECQSIQAPVVSDYGSTFSHASGRRPSRHNLDYRRSDQIEVRMKANFPGSEDWHILTGRCYKWDSFEAAYTWTIKVQKVCRLLGAVSLI
jgi:hypothetical protein